MPRIYLSPSLQPGNQTVLGVSEQFLMGLVADAMEPLLSANGIDFTRSRVGMTLAQVIAESNAGNFDAHVAVHSNASPQSGTARGSRHYFFTGSARGRRLAENTAEQFRNIYPSPEMVGIVPSTAIAELRQTRAPAVLVETAFHDNVMDAQWIQANIQNIAEAIVRGLTTYFGMIYEPPCSGDTTHATNATWTGFVWAEVCTRTENLNIRSAPEGDVIFTLGRGNQVIITGQEQNGFVPIRYQFWDGWASSQFICICNPPSMPTPAPPIGVTPPPVQPIPPIGTIPPVPPIGIVPPVRPTPPIGVTPPTIQPPIGITPPVPPVGIIPPVRPTPPIGITPPPVQPVPPIGITPPTMLAIGRVVTEWGRLNLRAAPSLDAEIIDKIPRGSRVLLLRQDGDWYYVFWNNQFGYVAKEFISV